MYSVQVLRTLFSDVFFQWKCCIVIYLDYQKQIKLDTFCGKCKKKNTKIYIKKKTKQKTKEQKRKKTQSREKKRFMQIEDFWPEFKEASRLVDLLNYFHWKAIFIQMVGHLSFKNCLWTLWHKIKSLLTELIYEHPPLSLWEQFYVPS